MNDDCCYKLYMHVNKINGKVYIGQTKKSYLSRWRNGKGYGECSRFAKAIEKYGWDEGFEHIPLIEELTKSDADYFERFFIGFFDAQNPEFGYNLTAGGDENPLDNPVVRGKHDEAVKKRSADPEWQKNVREGAKKRSADPEWQKNHREAMKKVFADPEWRENVRKANQTMHADPEWQKNHREAMKKRSANSEWRENVSEANRKKAQDPEYQKNYREAMKKMHADPEYQKKHREALKKMHADLEWQKKHREAHCKKVLCVETKIVYDSLTEAAVAVNLKTHTSISLCCSGKCKTAGGYHWEYV